jgi:hypothetical protein
MLSSCARALSTAAAAARQRSIDHETATILFGIVIAQVRKQAAKQAVCAFNSMC